MITAHEGGRVPTYYIRSNMSASPVETDVDIPPPNPLSSCRPKRSIGLDGQAFIAVQGVVSQPDPVDHTKPADSID